MGLFEKLEQKMNGDVKVQIEVLSPVDRSSPSFEAKITVSNEGDQPQTIKQVTANLLEIEKNINAQAGTPEVPLAVRSTKYDQPFSLPPGQSQVVNLTVPIYDDSAPEQLHTLAGMVGRLNSGSYTYYAQAMVGVDGKIVAPESRVSLDLLKFGDVGNINSNASI
jgi:hypothetical protein